ncbi:MAG: hypothetical protein OEM21_02780 [Nitrosopumilus sp.]|nr:hypothetical protein [Nitrosopumilus sp.]
MKNFLKSLNILVIFFIISFAATSPAYAHKLITHDDTHRSFETALQIPDHKISWAIYENLAANEAKFYSFEAKHGESLYASIVIPKMEDLETYSPTLVLVGDGIFQNDSIPFETSLGVQKIPYKGEFPSREFYEPFGQVTYWERQEVRMNIPTDGEYFIVVLDEKNQSGKYSLAIGTIEDFSGGDIFTTLPTAWIETKLFVNDYISIVIVVIILITIPIIPILFIVRKKVKQKISSN